MEIDYAALELVRGQLGKRQSEVNFKSLYESIQALETEELSFCPACATPLTGDGSVRENPYERARKGLSELSELAELQTKQAAATETVRESAEALRLLVSKTITTVAAALGFDLAIDLGPLITLTEAAQNQTETQWWATLELALEDQDAPLPSHWDVLLEIATAASAADVKAREIAKERVRLTDERTKLRLVEQAVIKQRTLREQFDQSLIAANKNIADFADKNKDLIEAVEKEKVVIAHHHQLSIAYTEFLEQLRQYRTGLPQTLTANLSEVTLNLYNGFNRYDLDADRLAKLILPSDETERIQVAFKSHPNVCV